MAVTANFPKSMGMTFVLPVTGIPQFVLKCKLMGHPPGNWHRLHRWRFSALTYGKSVIMERDGEALQNDYESVLARWFI